MKNTVVSIVIVSYNAEKTLAKTVAAIPPGADWRILLVDDASTDRTAEIARELKLDLTVHPVNRGYGASQKTGFSLALERGAGIVVLLHADYQYDPGRIPELVAPILEDKADAVFGSRMLDGCAIRGGMPLWKYWANRASTALANIVFGRHLSEYHSGMRAYSAAALRDLSYSANSNGYSFDIQMIYGLIRKNYSIAEVPVRARYFKEASSIGFPESLVYGFSFFQVLFAFMSNKPKPCLPNENP